MIFKKLTVQTLFSVAVSLSAFIFILLFVNLQQKKYSYYLYLYGESISPGSKALIKIITRDGEFVPAKEISINGKKTNSFLIDLRPDIQEISVKIGDSDVVFPIKYKELENIRVPVSEYLHISQKELENVSKPLSAANRTVFLLPDQFRAVSEFETKIHLYCLENGNPCKDEKVLINGIDRNLENGYLDFTTVFNNEQIVNILFADNISIAPKVPYSGKLFRFYSNDDGITIASLVDLNYVNIDCYSKGKWMGTDIISISSSGVRLPEEYKNCESIQASFNSYSPGTTYISISKSPVLKGEVNDPYYSLLAKNLSNFSKKAQYNFSSSYNSSFFKPLPMIFSGEILEKRFLDNKNKKLNFYWWMLLLTSLAGLVVFVVSVTRKMKVVEGIDGELISHSILKQRMILSGVVVMYVIFLTMFLYLLSNLA